MRNPIGPGPLLDRAYVENATLRPGVPLDVVPALLPMARPVNRVVPVDVYLPGCPPSADLIHRVLARPRRGPDARHDRREVRTMTTTAADRIVIDPVTRIEGHAKITIHLDEAGEVRDAQFHVTQFRGFERIVQGRPLHEMPSIMARICGICPVSHLVASAKACDEIIAVEPPPAGADLRRVMNLAQIAQSNALSFFHLASPDLLFGFDADAAGRNLFGVAAAAPRLARDGIAIRRFGQQVIEWLGGKRIHPSWIVPGGVDAPLAAETRDRILAAIPEALAASERAIAWYTAELVRFEEEAAIVRRLPVGLHGPRRLRTAPSTTTTACSGSMDADGALPRRPDRPARLRRTSSARPWSRGRSSSPRTGRPWATPRACIASGRSPG